MRGSVLFSFALLFAVRQEAPSQDIVSASAGVLQYFEGAVVLDGQPIEHKAAVFPSLKNGSVVRTEQGRAELLLAPAVYLRIDENTSLRMISNLLSDTRLELTSGAVILDTLNANSSSAPVLIFHGSEVRFIKPGVYRIDCDLGELQAYSGEAQVAHHRISTAIDSSHRYYFDLELTTEKFGEGATDEFYDWARNRSDVMADQLAAAAQNNGQDADVGAGIFVAPLLSSSPAYGGLATPSLGYSTYPGVMDPYFLYSPAPYFGFQPFTSIIVLSPYRFRSGVSRWPGGTTTSYHPPSVITRWPRPTPAFPSRLPGTPVHYPVNSGGYYRMGALVARPSVPAMPHAAPAPHVSAPHAFGRR